MRLGLPLLVAILLSAGVATAHEDKKTDDLKPADGRAGGPKGCSLRFINTKSVPAGRCSRISSTLCIPAGERPIRWGAIRANS